MNVKELKAMWERKSTQQTSKPLPKPINKQSSNQVILTQTNKQAQPQISKSNDYLHQVNKNGQLTVKQEIKKDKVYNKNQGEMKIMKQQDKKVENMMKQPEKDEQKRSSFQDLKSKFEKLHVPMGVSMSYYQPQTSSKLFLNGKNHQKQEQTQKESNSNDNDNQVKIDQKSNKNYEIEVDVDSHKSFQQKKLLAEKMLLNSRIGLGISKSHHNQNKTEEKQQKQQSHNQIDHLQDVDKKIKLKPQTYDYYDSQKQIDSRVDEISNRLFNEKSQRSKNQNHLDVPQQQINGRMTLDFRGDKNKKKKSHKQDFDDL